MKIISSMAVAAVAVSMLAPATLADGRNPGSALIFPVHRSSITSGGTAGQAVGFTIVSVTNINTAPVTPISFGGSTSVHYEYANVTRNPVNKFRPLACTIFNRIEFLTPADTLSVNTSCHNAAGIVGQEGYLVVSAQDPALFNTAWSHNYLVGSELVVNAAGGMYGLNAIPFEAIASEGSATDADGDGQLDFDDAEYEGIPDVLYIDSFVAVAGSQLALLNLTGGPLDVNTVGLTVWNDNEFPLSATLPFNCWFDCPLYKVSPLFNESFLKNSTPHDPYELDIDCTGTGRFETGWARIDSLGVMTPGGLPVDGDGALLGSISAGPRSSFDGGHLLWESTAKQLNGTAFNP